MKQAVYIAIIVVLVLVLAGIGVKALYDNQMQKAQEQAYQVGVANSVISIIQQSRDCKPLSLYIGNQTFQFIDVECLQAAQQSTENQPAEQ